MPDQEIVLRLDAEAAARIGTLAALSGLTKEELVRLLLEQAITEGVDQMLFDTDDEP